MSLDFSEKMQPQQHQLQHAQPQHNFIYESSGAEGISYHNDEEPSINYHQHFHQAQQQAAQQHTYPFTAATIHSNYLKEDQLYFLPHSNTTGQSNDFSNNNYHQNYNYNYNQQTNSSAQQQFATPFSLSFTGNSKASQNTPSGNSNTQSQNFVFQNSNNQYHQSANNSNNNHSNNKQFLTGIQQSQKTNKSTFSQNQYNFDLTNQDNIFLSNQHPTHYQAAATIVAAATCTQSNTCTSSKTLVNQGQFYKNVQDVLPSIQTLNDIDTVFSSTHDLQSMSHCSCPTSSNNNNQQAAQPLLQINQLVHTTSAPANYFYNESNNYKQIEGLVLDDAIINGMERKDSLEAKNEESISSQHSLCEKYSKSSKNTSPIMNACSGPIRKGSDSDSDLTKSSTTLGLNKQQSQLKNANKFCMVSLLNFLTDVLPNSKEFHHLIKYIIRVKGSGKMRQKVDIFTLAHFRVLFLTLNDWNITQLNANDIKMHKMIFNEVNKSGNWTKEDLDFMNSIKQQLLYISIQFFEDSAQIKQKIQQKSWQNEDTAKHYIEWVNRISKGIKKMSSGVYIHRF